MHYKPYMEDKHGQNLRNEGVLFTKFERTFKKLTAWRLAARSCHVNSLTDIES
jgi:hypothetical protein